LVTAKNQELGTKNIPLRKTRIWLGSLHVARKSKARKKSEMATRPNRLQAQDQAPETKSQAAKQHKKELGLERGIRDQNQVRPAAWDKYLLRTWKCKTELDNLRRALALETGEPQTKIWLAEETHGRKTQTQF
jgi:hypothetical protein